MHAARFDYYLRGGTPPDSARTYPGCRDHTAPRETMPVFLPGRLYFALESPAWTGGLALYDPLDPGRMPARAYLLTTAQFHDVAAQEMYRPPGVEPDADLTEALTAGRSTLGPGRYETLVKVGAAAGFPILTFTAPWRSADVAWNPPAAAYLRHLAAGLAEAHGWSPDRAARYLARCPGAAGSWTRTAIAALAATPRPQR
ncbi:histone deacetylase [Embleya sp. NBC_00896]|uniref:histone deacetylase n=1 Tax=Embleya sp. NBC_00896 TaxID=2975961 RepID=UPI002F913D0B|nr:histone deacetylase [Embleya sp. NBC_00896]